MLFSCPIHVHCVSYLQMLCALCHSLFCKKLIMIYFIPNMCLFHSFSSGTGFQGRGVCSWFLFGLMLDPPWFNVITSGPGFQGPGFISVQDIYKDVSDNWSHTHTYIYILIFKYIDILCIHIYIYIYTYICLFHSFSSGPGFQGPGLCWHVFFLIFPVVVRCPNSCWCHILFSKACWGQRDQNLECNCEDLGEAWPGGTGCC